MPLKISSCKLSLPVMRKNFTRFWPVWGSYLAIWILILPLGVLREGYRWGASDLPRTILGNATHISVVLSVIYGFLSAAAVWNYLYNHRSVSLYHALPVSRESMFLSHFVSGLGFLILPNVVTALFTWLACVGQGATAAASAVLPWLGAVCLQNLFYFCFATLLAMLTGNLPTHAVLYGILNLAGVLCELLLRSICSALIYGVYGNAPQFTFLSPPVHMLREYADYYAETSTAWQRLNFPMLLWYGLAGIVFAVLALLLYRRRDSERAGDVIAVPFLRPVAKYCFALGCALVLGFLFDLVIFEGREDFFAFCISLLLGGLIGYLTAAMLLKKSFRVFDKKTVLGFCALALVIVGTLVCMQLDVFGASGWMPNPNRLKGADVHSVGGSAYWEEGDDPARLEEILSVHRAAVREGMAEEAYATEVYLTYTLKNGRVVERRYAIDTSDASMADPGKTAGILNGIFNAPDELLRTILPPEDSTVVSIGLYVEDETLSANKNAEMYDYIYLNTDEFQLVLDAIRADVIAGDYGLWSPQQSYGYTSYSLEIDYSYPNVSNPTQRARMEGSRYLTFTKEEAPRTFQTLCRLGYLMPIGGVRP